MKNYTKILLLILFLTSSFSCKDEGECCTPPFACGVENPAENLPWLKAMIESWKSNNQELYTYMYVLQGKYFGETVIVIGSCCPFCDFASLIYNCSGDVINPLSAEPITDQKVIWKPLGSECNL